MAYVANLLFEYSRALQSQINILSIEACYIQCVHIIVKQVETVSLYLSLNCIFLTYLNIDLVKGFMIRS